jgi:hexosaminidase
MPARVSQGRETFWVDAARLDVTFDGGTSGDAGDLRELYDRYTPLIFPRGRLAAPIGGAVDGAAAVVSRLSFDVARPMLSVAPGEDESYALSIAADAIVVTAAGALGALRALETLSQLVEFVVTRDGGAPAYAVRRAPVAVADAPRWAHRGVLLDCARHFLPPPTLRRAVDALAALKV